MKKFLAMMLTVAMVTLVFTGCNKEESTGIELNDGETLQTVLEAVEADFTATHGEEVPFMAMPMEADDVILSDLMGVDLETVEEHYTVAAGMMPNFAEYISIKAVDGQVDAVVEALNQRKADLEAQYESYNVMGSYDRATNSEVYVKGNYVFLLAIGATNEDGEGGTYAEDVAAAKAVIDSKFTA